MSDMGTKKAADKWGVSQRQVQEWCRKVANSDSRITQDGKRRPWHIPENYPNPFSETKNN